MRVGCHVSIAGGVFNAPLNAAELGCEVFQIFSRSPRGGPAPAWTVENLEQFEVNVQATKQGAWAVHTPYYINYASANPKISKGSEVVVRDELERASRIKAANLMTHLGSSKDVGPVEGKKRTIAGLTKVLTGYTGSTTFCMEIAAGAGDVIGAKFEDIGEMIAGIETNVKKKNVVGVCFDTCHAFASGYDVRTSAGIKTTLEEFDHYIGLARLKLIHANDSKFGLGEKKDRHEHIGDGKIGLAGFKAMAKHPVLSKLDWFLETEHDKVKQDIAILKKIR